MLNLQGYVVNTIKHSLPAKMLTSSSFYVKKCHPRIDRSRNNHQQHCSHHHQHQHLHQQQHQHHLPHRSWSPLFYTRRRMPLVQRLVLDSGLMLLLLCSITTLLQGVEGKFKLIQLFSFSFYDTFQGNLENQRLK